MVMPPDAEATISSARRPRSRVCEPAFFDGAGAAVGSSDADSTSVIGAHFARRTGAGPLGRPPQRRGMGRSGRFQPRPDTKGLDRANAYLEYISHTALRRAMIARNAAAAGDRHTNEGESVCTHATN